MSIDKFFDDQKCRFDELVDYLDNLDQERRIHESTNLSAKQQQLLWDAAEGSERLSMDYFVPESCEPLEPVIHWGKNSLPAFTKFQKVMCRTSTPGEFSGYNVYALKSLIGDGYFVARNTSADEADDHGVVIDYTRVPKERNTSWPDIHCNERRLGRFFYSGNYDYMRRVSRHVSIGRAKKAKASHSHWMPNWFVLCREDKD